MDETVAIDAMMAEIKANPIPLKGLELQFAPPPLNTIYLQLAL